MRIRKAQNRITDTSKGFTMVELIVVLVVLAIVAAMVIPTLLGYTDRAREKQYITNAEMALKATESRLGEIFNDCDNRYSPQMREETKRTAQGRRWNSLYSMDGKGPFG